MNREIIDGLLGQAALGLFHPDIQRSLLEDQDFIRNSKISTSTILSLGQDGPRYNRSKFFDGIRKAIREPGGAIPVEDQGGLVWQLIAEHREDRFTFSLGSKERGPFPLTDHSALAEDLSIRTNWLERIAADILLDSASRKNWLYRMRNSPITDDDFVELMRDIDLTPVNFLEDLQERLKQSDITWSTLVPLESRYYERLIGLSEGSATASEYIETGAKFRIAELLLVNNLSGLSFALLMCSAGGISKSIKLNQVDRDELVKFYRWLTEYGDPLSQVGAVEIALSHLDILPELAPFVEQIVSGLLSEDPENDGSILVLLSTLVIAVTSELAKNRILGDIPPFYLRQAAIAHASLLVRAIKESRIDIASFTRWARILDGNEIYLLRGLIDLRREPRWLPEFIGTNQLRFEFIGRFSNAAIQNEGQIKQNTLQKLLLGEKSKLAQAFRWPYPNFPGPMEGSAALGPIFPNDALREVETALESTRLEANAFAVLINGALLFNMREDMACLAAAALRRVGFSLEGTENTDDNFRLIGGLAVLAAVTRCGDLAEAVRVLARGMRRRRQLTGGLDKELRIALVTAASFEEPEAWSRFAGEWLTEVSFETSDKMAAKALLHRLRQLVKLEPILAKHCATADAALDAFVH
ncbi:hypothetical protein [Comamonas koreensis]|uniref:GreAB-C-like domain-containing protein n=1 Tax=Comamonas koreensis TaxID=160825 RepID=A0AAW4XXD4_9BURK|nr:hypothetical protein [Comamonas koreensis]MCD2166239.1 hypothetical protein [Comamonas koreensis]